MDFLKKFTETSAPKAETTDQSAPSDQSEGDLFSSAKLVAGAARSTFQQDQAKYDNAEVAGAAADLLGAAQTYGKLDKTSGIGGYVDKAETYLHDYEASNTTKPKPSEEPADVESATKTITDEEPVAKPSSEDIPSQGQEEAEYPTKSVKPSFDDPPPSSEDVPSQGIEEEEPIKAEPKISTEDDVPSEDQKEVEKKPTGYTKPDTDEEPSYVGKGEEEEAPSVKEPETEEPASEIPSSAGEFAKIGEGFLKKNTEGDSAEVDAGESDEVGKYTKLANEYLSKPSEGSAGDESSDQSGVGGVAKLAGGFFK